MHARAAALSSEALRSTPRRCCYPLLTWRMMQEEEEWEEEDPSSILPLCTISLRSTPSSSHTHTSSGACYLRHKRACERAATSRPPLLLPPHLLQAQLLRAHLLRLLLLLLLQCICQILVV